MEQPKLFKKISELKEWDKNPRSIKESDFNRLKEQITRLGQYKPLLVTPGGEVIGGNMRLKAYRALGIEDIWVSIVEPKDENEKLAYALSDNDRAGYYDSDLIANLIPQYPEFNWGTYAIDLKEPLPLDQLIKQFSPEILDEIGLPSGDKAGFEQITFTLTNEQADHVRKALLKAKDAGSNDESNENSNGNAIAFICVKYNES